MINENSFWSKVNKTDDCWTWKVSCNEDGYGYFWVTGDHMRLAHRISWIIHYGEIPDGMNVCHHCDNPPCVRPDHLFLGTQLDNVRDCISKGRFTRGHVSGEQHGSCKLTKEEVIKIRNIYKNKEYKQKELAMMFNVSQSMISKIVRGEKWQVL